MGGHSSEVVQARFHTTSIVSAVEALAMQLKNTIQLGEFIIYKMIKSDLLLLGSLCSLGLSSSLHSVTPATPVTTSEGDTQG